MQGDISGVSNSHLCRFSIQNRQFLDRSIVASSYLKSWMVLHGHDDPKIAVVRNGNNDQRQNLLGVTQTLCEVVESREWSVEELELLHPWKEREVLQFERYPNTQVQQVLLQYSGGQTTRISTT